MSDPREYTVDYDWLWDNPPHNDGTPATVRLTVTNGQRDDAARRVDAWLESLDSDGEGNYFSGGWGVREAARDDAQVVLEITSGGEDVADGIEDGTQSAYDYLGEGTDLDLQWEQLPRC